MDVLGNFYIPEEQSVYLLSANDAQKLKDWIALCITELEKLGYRDISLPAGRQRRTVPSRSEGQPRQSV